MTNVLGVQKALKRFGGVELLHDVPPLLIRKRIGIAHRLNATLNPVFLLDVRQVHEGSTYLAGVRLTQDAQNFAQRQHLLAAQPTGDKLAVEIPHGKSVGRRIEFGVVAPLVAQRIDISLQVAPHTIRPNELQHSSLLLSHVQIAPRLVRAKLGRGICRHTKRLIRNAQVGKKLLIELIFAAKQLFDVVQELATSRPLNNAVVIGGGERHNRRYAGFAHDFAGISTVFRRIANGACPYNHALPRHQAGYAHRRANHAWVGERGGGVLEVSEL